MRIPSLLLLTALSSSFVASAQDVTEAYNLSNLKVQGTARSMGFGNALGSVGGDFSSLSVNPAGLGVYRSSELMFTPSLRLNSANSEYAGTTTTDNSTRFNINNFGMVFTNAPKGKRYDSKNWKAVSFAFGMNRSGDFNRKYTYQGNNNTSSATQVFESDANLYGVSTSPVNELGYIGYESYLLNQDAGGTYYSIVPFQGGVRQLKSVEETGNISEYVLSLGGNYKEKLMLGATLSLPSYRFDRTSYYTESLASGNNAPNPAGFNYFTYSQALNLTGSGVNAKVGAIYKISEMFRIGAAFHSPTYYSVTDIYSPAMNSSVTTSGYNNVILSVDNGALLQNQFDYHLTTPWKTVLSATVMIKKMGFITADYEFVDYSSMRYRFPSGVDNYGVSFKEYADAINRELKKTYQGTSNFRLGAEGRVNKNFMVRLGFGYYGNAYTPYGQTGGYTGARMDLCGGVGFRFKHFFTDLGFVNSMYNGYQQPYTVDYSGGSVISGAVATVPMATINYSLSNIALTVGVKL